MTSELPLPTVDETLVQRLRRLADARPERPLFIYQQDRGGGATTLTAGEAHLRASALAAHLQGMTRPGDRVLLVTPTGLEFHVAFLASLYAGLVAVPAYPPGVREKRGDRNFNRIASILKDCAPAVALTSQRGLDALKGTEGEGAFETLPLLASDAVAVDAVGHFQPPVVGLDEPAFLQYTSGSTSNPKGVVLTHRNIVANQALIARKFQNTDQTRIVSWLPVYHDMGLCCALLQGLYTGALSVLMSPLTFLMHPVRWLEAITRYQGQVSGAPNFAYDLCVARSRDEELAELDLSSWRLAFNGSEPVRAATLERFAKRFAPAGFAASSLYPCYGLAEATLFVSGGQRGEGVQVATVDRDTLGRGRVELASNEKSAVEMVGCGHDFAESDVQIVDPETLTPCAPACVGEIWVASASIGSGYWNRPELSQQTFHAQLPGQPGRRYLRTGDLGFLREGELFVAGRLKDLIIVHGTNHYPQDIERVAEGAHRALAPNACAAFSIDAGDGRESIVVLGEVARGTKGESAVEIAAAVRKAVAASLDLNLFAITLLRPGAIPRTSSGKIQRGLCRTRYQSREFQDVQYSA